MNSVAMQDSFSASVHEEEDTDEENGNVPRPRSSSTTLPPAVNNNETTKEEPMTEPVYEIVPNPKADRVDLSDLRGVRNNATTTSHNPAKGPSPNKNKNELLLGNPIPAKNTSDNNNNDHSHPALDNSNNTIDDTGELENLAELLPDIKLRLSNNANNANNTNIATHNNTTTKVLIPELTDSDDGAAAVEVCVEENTTAPHHHPTLFSGTKTGVGSTQAVKRRLAENRSPAANPNDSGLPTNNNNNNKKNTSSSNMESTRIIHPSDSMQGGGEGTTSSAFAAGTAAAAATTRKPSSTPPMIPSGQAQQPPPQQQVSHHPFVMRDVPDEDSTYDDDYPDSDHVLEDTNHSHTNNNDGTTKEVGSEFMNNLEAQSVSTATQTHEVRMPMYLPTFKPATGCTNASDFIVRCFVARLRSGITVVKHGRSRWCKSRLRILHIHPDGRSLSWKPAEGEPTSSKRPPKLDLSTCLEVRHAWSPDPQTPMYTGTPILRLKCEAANAHKSFALIFKQRTVDITAVTADQCKVLMEGFSALCFRLQVAHLATGGGTANNNTNKNATKNQHARPMPEEDGVSTTASNTLTNNSTPKGMGATITNTTAVGKVPR